MRRSILQLCIILGSTSAAARDDHRGNGGDVVVCRAPDGTPTTVELLDFYEGRHRLGFAVDLHEGMNYQEKLENALDRLAAVDPDRAAAYRARAESFVDETHFWENAVLVDIPDSAHIAVPRGCAIEQIAIQREPMFPEERYYTVSSDLWNQLDEAGKAGLVLHEIVFREALKVGHENSIATRYYTALITASSFDPASTKRYIDAADRLRFAIDRIGYRGLVFERRQTKFHPDGKIAEGNILGEGEWRLPGGPAIRLASTAKFHDSGELAAAVLAEDAEFTLEEGSVLANGYASFDEEGRLTFARISGNPSFKFGDQLLTFTNHIRVHAGRHVVGGFLQQGFLIELCLGGRVWIDSGTGVLFDETRTHLVGLGSHRRSRLCFRNADRGTIDVIPVEEAHNIVLDAEGAVREFYTQRAPHTVFVQGKPLQLRSAIKFHPNGRLAEAELAVESATLQASDGTIVNVREYQKLQFDADGFLIKPPPHS